MFCCLVVCAISFGFVVLVGIKCSICLICFICLGVVVGWVQEFVVLVILGACYCYRVLVVYLDLEVLLCCLVLDWLSCSVLCLLMVCRCY